MNVTFLDMMFASDSPHRWNVQERLETLASVVTQLEDNLWGIQGALSNGISTYLAKLIVALQIQVIGLREVGLMHPAALCVASRVLGEAIVKVC